MIVCCSNAVALLTQLSFPTEADMTPKTNTRVEDNNNDH